MIKADTFIQAAKAKGFDLYTGVPCSYLKPFINYVIDSDELRYVGAANEGDAVAIAAGAALAGQRAVVMFQNSGLGNAVNPLTSLTYTFDLPVLLIPTLRGEPGGPKDEPQHELMGAITTQMLDLMQIPWEYFPDENSKVDAALQRAVEYMDNKQRPYALVMKKDSVDKHPLQSSPKPVAISTEVKGRFNEPKHSRNEMLRLIQAQSHPDDIIIATTGYMGRELYACDDRANQLYMVGSMGCASSFALGLALAQPKRRVIVVDGDGALLMRMGALTTIAYERPTNLVHILLDNEVHESTGAQSTNAHSVDFAAIAAASAYPLVQRTTELNDVKSFLDNAGKTLSFIHVKIKPGIPADLPRPTITPAQVAQRLTAFIKES